MSQLMSTSIVMKILLLVSFFGLIHGLRWMRSGVPSSFQTMHLNYSYTNITVDVSFEIPVVIVRDVKHWNKSLIINCFVQGYSENTEFSYSFCKNDDPCLPVTDNVDSTNFMEFNLQGSFHTKFPDRKGLKIVIRIPRNYIDISGNYYCKVEKGKKSIRSNNIELRDTYFWQRKVFTKVESSYKPGVESISLDNVPRVMNCSGGNSELNGQMPSWASSQFRSPVSWSVCPVLKDYNKLNDTEKMSPEKCLTFTGTPCRDKISDRICPRKLDKMAGWKTYVTEKGDLLFLHIPQQNDNSGDTYLLMCYTRDADGNPQSISYFLDKKNDKDVEVGVAIDITKPVSTKVLKAKSPEIQHIILYSRQESSDEVLAPISLYALYESSPGVSYQWIFKGISLNSNDFLKVSKYMVTFEKGLSSDQSGKYTLQVTDSATNSNLKFQVNVKVLGEPMLDNYQCLPSVTYIWEGDSATFTCTFKNNPTLMKLLINSQEIQINDSLTVSQAQLQLSNPRLSNLSFSVSSTRQKHNIIFTYSVYNVQRTQDHSVTFSASNEFGIILKMSYIYVIPRLQSIATSFPVQDNCTLNCSSTDSHVFRCDFNLQEYQKKELFVEQHWTLDGLLISNINNTPSNVYSSYFSMDSNAKTLVLLPISSAKAQDKIIKDSLQKNELTCSISLRSSANDRVGFVYQFSDDISLKSKMVAKITLDLSRIATANLFWILGVVLAIIIIAILVALICLFQKKKEAKQIARNRAATGRESANETLLST